MKALVVFYSRTGNTRFVAETIANVFGAELQPIIDKKNRSGILGWLLAGRDAFLENKTEIESIKLDVKKYDLFFVGCPNWASKIPPALRTFLASVKLDRKKVVLFCTQDSNGAEKVFNSLRRLTQGSEIISEKFFNEVDKNQEAVKLQIKQWLESIK